MSPGIGSRHLPVGHLMLVVKSKQFLMCLQLKLTDLLYKESVHGRDLYCGRHLYQLRDGDGSHDNSSRCGPLLTIREALCSVLFTIYFQNQS